MIMRLSVPSVGAEVEEIRVLQWAGEPGQHFGTGDLIVELETHKAIIEIRAGQQGFLRQVLAAEGSWCKIGVIIALFSDEMSEIVPAEADAAVELSVEFVVS
jgi:pyruvate/2-oxoglutarate dehydrogenase complex dihydrolipoamide acyltransferase (E2) component